MPDSEPDNHIILSPPVFYFLLAAAGFGGAGTFGVVGPQIEHAAIEACYDNSRIAIEVAAQHGSEIQGLREDINDKTKYRYTSEDAARDRREMDREHAILIQRLNYLERNNGNGK